MQLFPVDYSSLSPKALLQLVVTHYKVKTPTTITFLKRGFNDTYLIHSGIEKFILRVYKHNWRTIESIETEVKLLNYLKENKIHVSYPLEDRSSNYIHALQAPEGVRYAVLFSYAEGVQVRKLSIEQSFLLGIETGKIHSLTKDRSFGITAQNYDVSFQFEQILKTIKQTLADHPEEYNYLLQLQKEFSTLFNEINPGEIAQGICHGDLQAENFHVSPDDQFTFFDFDFFGKGYLVYDIGVFMWYDHKNKPPEIIKSFLKGYETQRKLSAAELRSTPYFSTLRALFQMSLYCSISDGHQLPLWPAQEVANFIKKVEKWHSKVRF